MGFNLDIEDNMSPIELIDVGIFTLQDKKVLSYKPIILKPIQKTLSINFLWNGKDETYNNIVPNGEYKIVCLVQDKAGNKIKKEKKFEVKIPTKKPEKIVEKEEKIFYIEGAKVILDKRGVVVIYPTDELFIKNTTDIKPSMKKSLYSLGEIIKNKYSNKKILIEGHTDSVGDEKENKAKSLKYAESLSSFFVKELGMDSNIFEVKGFGEERPIASNKTKSGRVQNRRIEIILGK
jgi:outer membrane protein OmpA-like peptidoglycan-associated protein